jgi:Family of unknown function (DUF5695)
LFPCIDEQGFDAPAFHAFPDMLRIDPLSGDNGTNFFGYAWNAATYVVKHPDLGRICFGGNSSVSGDEITVDSRDASRTTFDLAPAGLRLTFGFRAIRSSCWDAKNRKAASRIAPKNAFTSEARVAD